MHVCISEIQNSVNSRITFDQFSANLTTTQPPVDEAVTNSTPNRPSTNETATNSSQSQVDQAPSNITANGIHINQTTTKPPQTNQHPVNLSSKNTTANLLQSDQLQFDTAFQTSQSATKGIIKYSSAL